MADVGLEPEQERRLRNRALARWLILAGPQPGIQLSTELVVRNGRTCAAVTADGKVLALYPVSGTGEHRRLYKAVPAVADPLLPLGPAEASRPDQTAQFERARALRTSVSAERSRSQALRAKSASLCTRAADLMAAFSIRTSR